MRLFVDSQLVSPYAMSVYVSLLEKGLTFDLESIDLAVKANLATAFAATSLTRRIPTLVHEDFALSESSAICEQPFIPLTRSFAHAHGKYKPGCAAIWCRSERNDQRSSYSAAQKDPRSRQTRARLPINSLRRRTHC
jgi:Glutathione S-transferase, N-terminal domain